MEVVRYQSGDCVALDLQYQIFGHKLSNSGCEKGIVFHSKTQTGLTQF